jgi:TonB family protein
LPLGLSESAVAAVERWRFEPATLHGQPVKVYLSLTVKFNLR